MSALIRNLATVDLDLFRFCNAVFTCQAGDWFFPFITEIRNFYIPYAVLLSALMIFGRSRGLFMVIVLVVVIVASDQLSSSFLKHLFERPRPCHVLTDVRLLVGCGGGWSFPSSHAVNNFAAAAVASAFYPRSARWLYGYALLVAYSRVYVGVHYPSDILGGALIGIFTAKAVMWSLAAVFGPLKKACTGYRCNIEKWAIRRTGTARRLDRGAQS